MKTLLALALSLFAVAANAGTVTVSWTSPSTCEDGSALSFCPTTGFEISEGTSLTGTFTVKETVAADITSRTYQNVGPGTRCYSGKTLSGDQKSAESTRACTNVASLPPKAPQGMTVTVTVTVETP